MSGIGLRRRLHYRFDNIASRGPGAMIVMLFVTTVAMVILIALIVRMSGTDPEGRNFLQIAWAGLLRTLDPGTMGGDQGPVVFLLSMLAMTIGGIFVVGTLIGILTNGIDSKLVQLRKGRSFVAEEGHTIILGWSSQIPTVVSKLVEANSNRKHACIAILADRDKVEMEDEIRAKVPFTRTTRVVCRTGSPIEMGDLEIVNHRGARSIVILPPEDEDPDSGVIKTVLALVNNPNRRDTPYHIVGVLQSAENMTVVDMVGGREVQMVLVGDLIARISAQTCRQTGLSLVYTELLDFGGDEIYYAAVPSLAEKSFRELVHGFEDSSVIGICRADGETLLNPPADAVFHEGDCVIAISEDDDTVIPSGLPPARVREDLLRDARPAPPGPERTVILGYNCRVPILIRELDGYVGPGSTVHLVAETEELRDVQSLVQGDYSNLTVTVSRASTTDRSVLNSLDLERCHHVIIQSYSDRMSAQKADARTLITLLHLRNIRETRSLGFSIVSEMMDDRNRELAEVAKADDFIVSDKLVSLMLTQISENRELKGLFAELFDPSGSEIYLKPVEHYVATGVEMDFHTVVEAAIRKGEIAIGYRIASRAQDACAAHGVVVNPTKSSPVTFSQGDRIVVLADD